MCGRKVSFFCGFFKIKAFKSNIRTTDNYFGRGLKSAAPHLSNLLENIKAAFEPAIRVDPTFCIHQNGCPSAGVETKASGQMICTLFI